MENLQIDKMKNYAPIVVRIGMSLVFLWFGAQQWLDVDAWSGLIPEWATSTSGLSAETFVYINGTFELIFGALLLLGLFTRVAAFLLSLHMIHITLTVGYNEIGVRDFGLSLATISVFLHGLDDWCLDRKIRQN